MFYTVVVNDKNAYKLRCNLKGKVREVNIVKKTTLNKIRRIAVIALVICMAFSGTVFAGNNGGTKIHHANGLGLNNRDQVRIGGHTYTYQGSTLETETQIELSEGKDYDVYNEKGEKIATITVSSNGKGNVQDNEQHATDNYDVSNCILARKSERKTQGKQGRIPNENQKAGKVMKK